MMSMVSVWNDTDTSGSTDQIDVPDVMLFIKDSNGEIVKKVLPDGNGTEVSIDSSDIPSPKPGNQPSSSKGDEGGSPRSWELPPLPDEKKRRACVGTEAVRYTQPKDNAYRVEIENSIQGPRCFDSFEAVLGDYTIGRTYNIYADSKKTYSKDKKVQFTIKIPEQIYKDDRKYKMICVTKNGVPVLYEDLDDNLETVTIKTNQFYAYALIYQ